MPFAIFLCIMAVRSRLKVLLESFDPRVLQRTRERIDEVRDTTRELRRALSLLEIRTEQLLLLERLNWQQRERLARLPQLLDGPAVQRHVSAAVDRATLVLDPFPHFVVEEWLPADLYAAVLAAIPPAVFFAEKPSHKQQLAVPPPIAPELSRQVWSFLAERVVAGFLEPAILQKLETQTDDYVRSICPDVGDAWTQHVRIHGSDGRLMLRRPGYLLEPHRDPRWGFVTCLAYLARPGDDERHGTQLYRVRNDRLAPDESVFYPEMDDCDLVDTVPFRANHLFVFLNSAGAHGGSIPADAPAATERYMYQFRMGPDLDGIRWLLARMPPGQRALWAGIKTERAGY